MFENSFNGWKKFEYHYNKRNGLEFIKAKDKKNWKLKVESWKLKVESKSGSEEIIAKRKILKLLKPWTFFLIQQHTNAKRSSFADRVRHSLATAQATEDKENAKHLFPCWISKELRNSLWNAKLEPRVAIADRARRRQTLKPRNAKPETLKLWNPETLYSLPTRTL